MFKNSWNSRKKSEFSAQRDTLTMATKLKGTVTFGLEPR